MVSSLKNKVKLKKIFKFIYAAKAFCTNKNYAVKEFIIIFQLFVSLTLLLQMLCPVTPISHKIYKMKFL
jgi:hypothetical protein